MILPITQQGFGNGHGEGKDVQGAWVQAANTVPRALRCMLSAIIASHRGRRIELG